MLENSVDYRPALPLEGQLSDDSGVELRRILQALRRRLVIVVGLAAIAAVASFVYFHHKPKQYTATASLVFNSQSQVADVAGVATSATAPDPDTNVQLVTLGNTAAQTAKQVGSNLTAAAVKSMLSIQAVGTTDIVNVSATTSTPALAARVATTYATTFVANQQSANRQLYLSALSLVTKQLQQLPASQQASSDAVSLQTRAQTLSLLAAVGSNAVAVAQTATPPSVPSGPKVTEDTVVAGIVGLLIGLGIAFSIELFDRRIRSSEDFESLYSLPLLGTVPVFDAPAKSTDRSGPGIPAVVPEAFQLIQAHLQYYNVDKKLQAILITSAAPGDGKTTTACHLASAFSRLGSRVLLIEADIRRPTLASQVGVLATSGLTDVLIHTAAIEDVIVAVDVGPGTNSGFAVDMLFAGSSDAPNPAALIGSESMKGVVQWAREHYDLILFDTPPVTAVSDAFPLFGQVDGVVVVGRIEYDTRDAVRLSADTLHGGHAPLLGVVVNGVKASVSYGYNAYTTGA